MKNLFRKVYGTYRDMKGDKRGYTLAELMVTLVIIGILAAAAIPSALYFIKAAEFRKNEENAKTVYLAAESMLTWYRASGEWEAFRREIMEYGTPNTTFGEGDERNGRIYAVMLNRGDRAESGSGSQVMKLLDGGVYGGDFFDAAIAIEVDVESGQVYSAFYGTRCSALTYGEPSDEEELNIGSDGEIRAYHNRKDVLLGYYSVEDVVNVVELKPVRLKVTTINLVNSETLSLNWTSNSRHDNRDVKYIISFYREGGEKLFTTEVELGRLIGGLQADGGEEAGTRTGMVNLDLTDASGMDLGSWAFPLSYQKTGGSGGRLSLVLDGMMTAGLREAVEAKGAGGGLNYAERNFSTSITRLGEVIEALKEPQDIYAEIVIQPTYEIRDEEYTEYKSGSPVRSNVENTLFAEVLAGMRPGADGGEEMCMKAEIRAFRHLSNIQYGNPQTRTVFTLDDINLDWTSPGVGMYGISGSETQDGYRTVCWEGASRDGAVSDFPSIPLLAEKHSLEGKGAATISNLRLGAGSAPDDGLIDELYTGERKGKYTRYLGLFGRADGFIKGLTLLDPVLYLASGQGEGVFYSLQGVGILCGRSGGGLADIAVKTTNAGHQTLWVRMDKGAEDGPAAIGGLAGIFAGETEDGSLEALTDEGIVISGLSMEGVITGFLPEPGRQRDTGYGGESGAGGGLPAPDGGFCSLEEAAVEYAYGIGGIFGYAWIGREGDGVQVAGCSNHADITGNLFTGGIGGSLKGGYVSQGADSPVSMSACFNDGMVLCSAGHQDGEGLLEGRCFGGILGYGNGARIDDSVNASRCRDIYDDTKKESLLLGQYVGGIIGYGYNSRLAGCSTRKGSYVLGSDYVGGIAGGLSNDLKEAITAGITVTVNGGYVIGNRYVGGIVGKNDGPRPTTIANCVNNGVAAGYDRYVGGIVGYNGKNGILMDCASYLSDYDGSIFRTIVEDWKAAGDCAGGLAGYNNGKVEFTAGSWIIQVKSVSGIVVGGDFVGGIIGFNDVDGLLDVHYTLIGGRIYGYGDGVGGCIGLNASPEILDKELSVQPVSVTGHYFVGGCIGANVVDIEADMSMTGFRADNRLGNIEGAAFTGGVIGYQRTYTEGQLEQALVAAGRMAVREGAGGGREAGKMSLLAYLDAMEDIMGEDSGSGNGMPAGLLPGLGGGNVPTEVMVSQNPHILTIGSGAWAAPVEYNNIPILSNLYTGGIVGYCERGSRLVIVNCMNSGNLRSLADAPGGVSLKAYLASREVGADTGELGEGDFEISVSGGIIGANLENQVIDRCVNTGTMNGFIGLGGIVGINAGGVFNCLLADNFGNMGLDYIGGIAGLNIHGGALPGMQEAGTRTFHYTDAGGKAWTYVSGTIACCGTREKKNISGRSYVGGIAGYNMAGAVLQSNTNHADVTGAGDYVGGIAGANGGIIWVSHSEGGRAYAVTGNNGQGIGGIVGWNRREGSIDVMVPPESPGGEVVAVNTDVSVTGREKVGGIIGIHEGKLEISGDGGASVPCYLVCRAQAVRAAEGYAGGIVGQVRIDSPEEGRDGEEPVPVMRIVRAVNESVSVTADRGPAGGIVAVNPRGVWLEECAGRGGVNSDQGYAGGITSENHGWIVGCEAGGREEAGGMITIRSRGADAIGCVCAVNYGIIRNSVPVKAVTLSGTAEYVGGIAGVNAAGGRIEGTGRVMSYMPEINIENTALTVGGVAGVNRSGGLENPALIRDITVKGIRFEGFANYRYLGGVAGENQNGSMVEDCAFEEGVIRQGRGIAAGNCYGGVAGRNGGILKDCRIGGITIDVQGVYTATSTSTAREKEDLSSHIGGIAGKNEEGGVITGCVVAGGSGSRITVGSGMAGGVAGYNKGVIMFSGDGLTAALMKREGDGTAVMDVGELAENAGKAGIRADTDYVVWNQAAALEEQRYYAAKGNGRTVIEGRTLMLVMSTNGNLGGITAYNAPTGEVDYCATGNWYLNNKSEAIGVGTGGIIGMNESEKDLLFLLNRAFVGRQLLKADTNRFAGGIIGNQNNTTGSGWTIGNCINYGTIYCKNTHYSGGIVGQWTGRGGSVEKCVNYGNMQTTLTVGWLGASGGIVAQLYHAYENNEYNITGCANYGNIFGQTGRSTGNCANDSAGILGNVTAYKVDDERNSQRFTINVVDCVNGAGVEVYSQSMASGIVGYLSVDDPEAGGGDAAAKIAVSTSNIVLRIERCRNYASVMQGNNFVAGIFGDRYGETGSRNTTLKYCFSVNPGGGYNKSPFPIVSYQNAVYQKYVSEINRGQSGVCNYFLSGNSGINSFVDSGGSLGNTPTGGTSLLGRVNSGWVYTFPKNNIRYFVYLHSGKDMKVNRITLGGEDFGDAVLYNDNQVGYVLFAIKDEEDAAAYSSMERIVQDAEKAPGRGFDKYVREFCLIRAGLLNAPEKVTLAKAEGEGRFAIQVEAQSYADGDNIEYVAALYRRGDDGKDYLVGTEEITDDTGAPVEADDGLEGTFRFGRSTYIFRISDEETGKGGRLFVRVRVRRTDDTGMESPEAESNLVPLGDILQDPEIRIELVKEGGRYQYRFRLANREDYEGRDDLQVYVRLMDGKELVFGPDETAGCEISGDSLQQLLVWVKEPDGGDSGTGASSLEVSVPVYLPAYLPLIDVAGEEPQCAVTGTNLKDLGIAVTLKGPSGNVTTPPVYRAELVGTWTDEGGREHRDYVFAAADILTVANGEAKAAFTDFDTWRNGFSEAVDIRLRVWYAQSGLGPVYTYYTDLSSGEASNTRIREEEDGVEVWKDAYTHVLEDKEFEKYRWKSDILFEWLPAPTLAKLPEGGSLTPETDPESGHLSYTFSWDEDLYRPGDRYIVSVRGITIDEWGNAAPSVSIVSDVEVEGNSLTLDAENWPYQEVELSVTRKGLVQGTSVKIGKTSVGNYAVKKRLPRPSQARVTNPDVNELDYVIEWEPVSPEIGQDAGRPDAGCVSYRIFIRPVEPRPEGGPDGSLTVDVDVKDEAGNANITVYGVYRKKINLEDYAGERVLVSVRAQAAQDDAVYVDSVEGVTYELTVPERIAAPKVTWKKSWVHEEGRPVSVEEFQDGGQDGLKVTVEAEADSIPPGGSSYLIKAYIFADQESAMKAQNGGDKIVEDAEGLLTVYPGTDAEGRPVLVGMEPDGNNSFSHSFSGLSAEYAGKYVLLSARISSGGGQVGSRWTVNPEVWRLPYVKLPMPKVRAENGERQTEVALIRNPDLPGPDQEGPDQNGGTVSGNESSGVGNGMAGENGTVSGNGPADMGNIAAGAYGTVSGNESAGMGNGMAGEDGTVSGNGPADMGNIAAGAYGTVSGNEPGVRENVPDGVQETSLWISENTVLIWSSVEYGNTHYIILEDDDEKEGMTQEFKIVESGTAGVSPSVRVYWKDDAGQWQEAAGAEGVFDLSRYHKLVEGQYEEAVGYYVPYLVDLKARLEVAGLDGGFVYTLVLPDANRLVPGDGGNDITDSGLRFTDSVRIWSDVEENEEAPYSEAYVRSEECKIRFGN